MQSSISPRVIEPGSNIICRSVFDTRSRHGRQIKQILIPNALCLPVEEIDSRFSALEQALDSEHPLIVYCQNRMCDDALVLALELRDMGQSNLLYYVDGLEMWKEAGCPLETP